MNTKSAAKAYRANSWLTVKFYDKKKGPYQAPLNTYALEVIIF